MAARLNVPKPRDGAPVHEWLNWFAFCFAEQARVDGDAYIAPAELQGFVTMFLELGERSLRQHMALDQAGIEPGGGPLIFCGNIVSLMAVSAERSRQAVEAIQLAGPRSPTGGSAA